MLLRGLPLWLRQLRICLQCGQPGFDPWIRKIPWRREWQPTPVLLPGEFHGKRSLAGYSPWVCKELDMTEHLTYTHAFKGRGGRPKWVSLANRLCGVWKRMGEMLTGEGAVWGSYSLIFIPMPPSRREERYLSLFGLDWKLHGVGKLSARLIFL